MNPFNFRGFGIGLILGLAVSCSCAWAQTPTKVEFKPIGLHVEISGKGAPMIFIPGLTCGGSVWDSVVLKYQSKYTCYVITLPGFGGQAPVTNRPLLIAERDAIEKYVVDHKLKSPIVIGHSLGGFLAWWLASDKPDLFRAIVAVDGVPYLGALQDKTTTPESMKKVADAAVAEYSNMKPDQFKAATNSALIFQIKDPKMVTKVAETCDLSDPATTGEAVMEMLTTDLRPEVAKVKIPVLQFMSGAFYTTPKMQTAAEAAYSGQMKLAPEAKLVDATKARHFIFLDDPKFFFTQVDRFLKNLPKTK